MKTRLKNECGKTYGPWVVADLLPVRYPKNGMARFTVHCQYCGYKKTYIGNGLQYGHYARECKRCGMR